MTLLGYLESKSYFIVNPIVINTEVTFSISNACNSKRR